MIVGKALEYQGYDVYYCPISNLGHTQKNRASVILDLPSDKVNTYKEYLDSIGMSKEKIQNSKKTYICTDYGGGCSIGFFKQLLERPEIGINSENVQYKKLIFEVAMSKPTSDEFWQDFEFENKKYSIGGLTCNYFDNSHLKAYYYPTWSLNFKDLDRVKEIIDEPDVRPTKQMQFALIDYFYQNGLLKE